MSTPSFALSIVRDAKENREDKVDRAKSCDEKKMLVSSCALVRVSNFFRLVHEFAVVVFFSFLCLK